MPLSKGEKSKTASSPTTAAAAAAAGATASVPAVTPVREDLGGMMVGASMGFMVRSQSLNSPLVGPQAKLAECCVVRGESDPVGERIRRHRRRHSGEQVGN